jgi:hypothetical protein
MLRKSKNKVKVVTRVKRIKQYAGACVTEYNVGLM